MSCKSHNQVRELHIVDSGLKSRRLLLLGVAFALILTTHVAVGQSFRGRVQGTITDDSNAVIAGASVTLLNVNTGVKAARQTTQAGFYLFDNVDPGSYSVTVEMPGFSKFTQENVLVQSGGDITVNATLKLGSVQSQVTVTEKPAALEFNSSNKDLVIDTTMAKEVPRLDRNPFKLTLLAPSAVNTRGEMQPYHSWSMNSVDLGGGTNLANDLQVDGSPIGLGHKGSYPPNTDAVQEVIVSQNSVDAEVGHSAGGLISMTTKAGTNEWHGTGFYVGRYPWLSAEADRTRFTEFATPAHVSAAHSATPSSRTSCSTSSRWSIGRWAIRTATTNTVPTALERAGRFLAVVQHKRRPPHGLRPVDDETGSSHRSRSVERHSPETRFRQTVSIRSPARLMKEFWDPKSLATTSPASTTTKRAISRITTTTTSPNAATTTSTTAGEPSGASAGTTRMT